MEWKFDRVRKKRNGDSLLLIFACFFERQLHILATAFFHGFAFAARFLFLETYKRNRFDFSAAIMQIDCESDTYQKVKCNKAIYQNRSHNRKNMKFK